MDTSLDVDELVSVLSDAVLPMSAHRRWPWNREQGFAGDVWNHGFEFSRLIAHRNSFRPVVYGKYHARTGGTRIDVRIVWHPIVLVFSIAWFFGAVASLVGSIGVSIILFIIRWSEGTFNQNDLLFLGLAALWAGMVSVFLAVSITLYNYEANKATEFLQGVFEPYRKQ